VDDGYVGRGTVGTCRRFRENGMHCTSYQVLGSDLPEPRLVSTHRGSQDAASDCNSPSPTY
jgi:hypothetical protein